MLRPRFNAVLAILLSLLPVKTRSGQAVGSERAGLVVDLTAYYSAAWGVMVLATNLSVALTRPVVLIVVAR